MDWNLKQTRDKGAREGGGRGGCSNCFNFFLLSISTHVTYIGFTTKKKRKTLYTKIDA